MTMNYAYTPAIWPSVCTVILLIVLAVYSGRRQGIPGATPFMVACLIAAAWAFGSLVEIAAVDLETKIFWFKFQAIIQMPIVIAVTCFILEYTWPGRWLTRRNLVLLSLPFLLGVPLMLTDNITHLAWRGFSVNESVIPIWGSGGLLLVVYFVVLVILDLIIFGWLFLHSPQHRWPVMLMLLGQLFGRALFMLEKIYTIQFVPPLDLLGMMIEFLMYAIALFGFRIFDPVALARQAVITQMREGMLVLDLAGRVASLNPAAAAILGSPAKRMIGRPIHEILPAYYDLAGDLQPAGADQVELRVGTGSETRYFQLETSLLNDWRGLEAGRLLLLHDVTAQKRAQVLLLDRERALAMLHEREQLARELHDSTGQVLGYVKLQAQAARDLLAQDQITAADSSLAQLVAIAQDAQVDVREYILGAKIAATAPSGLLPVLDRYLMTFSEHYKLRTKLIVPPDWNDNLLEPTVEAQLLRIIQEALTNSRKHAHAQCVQVRLIHSDSQVQVVVQDDGVGFDPQLLANSKGQKYGLGFMRQRAEEAGGSFDVQSIPGEGTRVVVEMPVRQVNGVSKPYTVHYPQV